MPACLATVGEKLILTIAPTTNRPGLEAEIDSLRALAAGKLDLEAGIALWDAILATVSPGGGLNPSDVVYAITDGALSTPLTRIHRHG